MVSEFELISLVNIVITIIGIASAYYIGRTQSKRDMRNATYNEFLEVIIEGYKHFPTLQRGRTGEQLRALNDWFSAFDSARGKIKVFGSKDVNSIIDTKLEEDDKLDDTLIEQLDVLNIKLTSNQLKLSKQLNTKDKYDRFYEEITTLMGKEISKPWWNLWKS